jgi:hypothetical protein
LQTDAFVVLTVGLFADAAGWFANHAQGIVTDMTVGGMFGAEAMSTRLERVGMRLAKDLLAGGAAPPTTGTRRFAANGTGGDVRRGFVTGGTFVQAGATVGLPIDLVV